MAQAVLRTLDLPHPDRQLLECFLQDSIDHERAAHYMLRRCDFGRNDAGMTSFLSDWKELIAIFVCEETTRHVTEKRVTADITRRDGGKCSITGMSNSFLDPLVVVPIFPRVKNHVKSFNEMLSAFLTPTMRDWIFSDAGSHTSRNYWLVRKSAATAFSQGFFQFTFNNGHEYHVSAGRIGGPKWPPIVLKCQILRRGSFVDHSASNIDLPDVSALKVLACFANPIRWTYVAQEIARKQPYAPRPSILSPLGSFLLVRCTPALLVTWLKVPDRVRIRVYRILALIGAYIYGPTCSLKVQQLPFGMYLKTTSSEWQEGLTNEYGALQLVRRHTHIPVPRTLDLVSDSTDTYLLTSRLAGSRLGLCIDTLSDQEVKTLIRDLQKGLAALRVIPKLVAPEYAITNAVGGACLDYRIIAGLNYDESRGDFVGPFANEEEFNHILQVGALPDIAHRSGHRVVFTHADLNLRNILVHNGKLAGLVDWENSGWYPEYWDYTKAHYISKLNLRWLKMVDDVFNKFGNFKDDLEIERQLWSYCF